VAACSSEGLIVKARFRDWLKDRHPYLEFNGDVDDLASDISDDLVSIAGRRQD